MSKQVLQKQKLKKVTASYVNFFFNEIPVLKRISDKIIILEQLTLTLLASELVVGFFRSN